MLATAFSSACQSEYRGWLKNSHFVFGMSLTHFHWASAMSIKLPRICSFFSIGEHLVMLMTFCSTACGAGSPMTFIFLLITHTHTHIHSYKTTPPLPLSPTDMQEFAGRGRMLLWFYGPKSATVDEAAQRHHSRQGREDHTKHSVSVYTIPPRIHQTFNVFPLYLVPPHKPTVSSWPGCCRTMVRWRGQAARTWACARSPTCGSKTFRCRTRTWSTTCLPCCRTIRWPCRCSWSARPRSGCSKPSGRSTPRAASASEVNLRAVSSSFSSCISLWPSCAELPSG